jgi:hypothetical protein
MSVNLQKITFGYSLNIHTCRTPCQLGNHLVALFLKQEIDKDTTSKWARHRGFAKNGWLGFSHILSVDRT